jgi:hypothetical protein
MQIEGSCLMAYQTRLTALVLAVTVPFCPASFFHVLFKICSVDICSVRSQELGVSVEGCLEEVCFRGGMAVESRGR